MYKPGCAEHYVIHVLRDDPAFVPELDFVMEQDGKLMIAGLKSRALRQKPEMLQEHHRMEHRSRAG